MEQNGFVNVQERQKFFATVHRSSLSAMQWLLGPMSSSESSSKTFEKLWQSWLSSGEVKVETTDSNVRFILRGHPFVLSSAARKTMAWWFAAGCSKSNARPTPTVQPDGSLMVLVSPVAT